MARLPLSICPATNIGRHEEEWWTRYSTDARNAGIPATLQIRSRQQAGISPRSLMCRTRDSLWSHVPDAATVSSTGRMAVRRGISLTSSPAIDQPLAREVSSHLSSTDCSSPLLSREMSISAAVFPVLWILCPREVIGTAPIWL